MTPPKKSSHMSDWTDYPVVIALIISLITTFLLGMLLTEVLWGTGLNYFHEVSEAGRIEKTHAKNSRFRSRDGGGSIDPIDYSTPYRNCSQTTAYDTLGSPLVPLDEMAEPYIGFASHIYQPGLYSSAYLEKETAYLTLGRTFAQGIQPLDPQGNVCDAQDADCQIGFVSIGLSNSQQEWSGITHDGAADSTKGFVYKAMNYPQKRSEVNVFNAARGGMEARCISGDEPDACACPDCVNGPSNNSFEFYWDEFVPQKIQGARITPEQVQVVWLKMANRYYGDDHVDRLITNTKHTISLARQMFPNAHIFYLTSRMYGGYITFDPILNREPFAYEQGFAMRDVIDSYLDQRQIYVNWGQYVWANGTIPRKNLNGLTWECLDVRDDDGQHPTILGVDKYTDQLMDFFTTDEVSRMWLLE